MSFPDLLITYTDSAGAQTERTISPLEIVDEAYVYATCHVREEKRSFKISRIVTAVDVSTSEVIEDLFAFFGASKPPLPQPTPEVILTPAEIKKRRQTERRNFLKEYRYEVIKEHHFKKFFQLFDNRCFKCGLTERNRLAMDHHIPIARGGHFVPGNLVPLCIDCNNRKSDKPPEAFYTQEELERLQPLLAAQQNLLPFKFDFDRWGDDREGYLLDIGIDPALVHEVLHNEDHPLYVGYYRGCVITLPSYPIS